MTVHLEGHAIHLQGECRVEDAERLLEHLQADRSRRVDLSRAGTLHTAVVQVLLALRPAISGRSDDPFVRDWIEPLLSQEQASNAAVLLPKGLDRP
jgi:ABC-type transporter Mla MlaB component